MHHSQMSTATAVMTHPGTTRAATQATHCSLHGPPSAQSDNTGHHSRLHRQQCFAFSGGHNVHLHHLFSVSEATALRCYTNLIIIIIIISEASMKHLPENKVKFTTCSCSLGYNRFPRSHNYGSCN